MQRIFVEKNGLNCQVSTTSSSQNIANIQGIKVAKIQRILWKIFFHASLVYSQILFKSSCGWLLVWPCYKIEKEHWWVGVPTLFFVGEISAKAKLKKKLVSEVDVEGFQSPKFRKK